jgi:hypothetical protein
MGLQRVLILLGILSFFFNMTGLVPRVGEHPEESEGKTKGGVKISVSSAHGNSKYLYQIYQEQKLHLETYIFLLGVFFMSLGYEKCVVATRSPHMKRGQRVQFASLTSGKWSIHSHMSMARPRARPPSAPQAARLPQWPRGWSCSILMLSGRRVAHAVQEATCIRGPNP